MSKRDRDIYGVMSTLVRTTAAILGETESRTETLLKEVKWDEKQVSSVCSNYDEKKQWFEKLNMAMPLPRVDSVSSSSSTLSSSLLPVTPLGAPGNCHPPLAPTIEQENELSYKQETTNKRKTQGTGALKAIPDAEEEGGERTAGVEVSKLHDSAPASALKMPGGNYVKDDAKRHAVCEICMVEMTGSIESPNDLLECVRARVRNEKGDSSCPHERFVTLNDGESELALTCAAGHSYCLSCWSQNATTKVLENGFSSSVSSFSVRGNHGREVGFSLAAEGRGNGRNESRH